MLKQIIALGAIFALFPAAYAQDARQIEQVRAGKSCPGCNLFQAELSYLDLPGLDLSGSRLRQADMSLSTMNGTDFGAANLSVSNMFAGRFSGADFSDSDLARANMVGAYFGGADFRNANLAGAILSGAELETAKNLTQTQLDQTCGDEATLLPAGLRIPSCQKLLARQAH